MSHGQPFRSVSKIQLSIMERNTCTPSFSPFWSTFSQGAQKHNIWHFLDSAKLHSMRSWPHIHLVYFFWHILIFPREIVLDSMRNCIPSAIDLKAITTEGKEKAKTFWQFCFYAWVALATLMVTNKQINCCQECHSGFTIESRCSTGIPATQILIFVLSHIPRKSGKLAMLLCPPLLWCCREYVTLFRRFGVNMTTMSCFCMQAAIHNTSLPLYAPHTIILNRFFLKLTKNELKRSCYCNEATMRHPKCSCI